ncbi:hypothetical protein [Sphingomonas sp. LY160]|uniref:hypothetical protein n=1 Tax=Sphingomonas sp. LY160 TaxID=3095342 RepID=UPI002ADEBBC6|nr:hypothetical protein [Sphingomonas sp. LY160]MEA1073136.1 hypothetical protein [Sphingomonas sp. LY160]
MTHEFLAHPTLEAALVHKYRGHDIRDWDEWRAHHFYDSADAIPAQATKAQIARIADPAALATKQALRHLIVSNCTQATLAAIGELKRLERLELEWPTLASDLSPLSNLSHLKFLSIDSPRKVTDFAPLARLPRLTTLIIANAKHLSDVEWLRGAHHLQVIGLEGAMDTRQTIDSLMPLSGLQRLEAFLGTSLRLLDQDLTPLATCPRLKLISISRVAKKPEFNALRDQRPDIVCGWFADRLWDGAKLRQL